MLLGIIITLLILSFLVLIHEGGHFTAAKLFGIKVEEFGFGLPPRAWGKKFGETLYSINWLPIGGFVRLLGEDEAGSGKIELNDKSQQINPDELDRAFFARPVYQRALVVTAGVIMNTIAAVIVYYVYLGMSGFEVKLPLLNDHKFFGVNQENKIDGLVVTGVTAGSPAAKAGIRQCSQENKYCVKIVKADDKIFNSSDEFLSYIKSRRGKEVRFELLEMVSSKKLTVNIIPRVNPPKDQGSLGIVFGANDIAVLRYATPEQKFWSGIIHPVNLMSYNYDLLKMFIKISITKRDIGPVSEAVSGPVGVFNIGGVIGGIEDGRQRFMEFLNLTGLLSISLAFFNILPIPALDGGRLFFIMIEGVFRKKVDPKYENLAHSIGMALLLGLIFLITAKDIFQIFM